MDPEVLSAIDTYVNSSFYNQSEILSLICDQNFAPDELNKEVIELIIADKIKLKSIAELGWPKLTHNDLLDRFFKRLNKAGILSLQNVNNYASGLDEVTDIYQSQKNNNFEFRGFCFYQWQDTEVAINGGGLRFSFGDLDGDKQSIIKIGELIFNEIGKTLPKAEWSGTQEKKILISTFKWRRRFKLL
jgi:hypothetical protein